MPHFYKQLSNTEYDNLRNKSKITEDEFAKLSLEYQVRKNNNKMPHHLTKYYYLNDDDQDDTSQGNVLPSTNKFREALSNHKENLMMSTFRIKSGTMKIGDPVLLKDKDELSYNVLTGKWIGFYRSYIPNRPQLQVMAHGDYADFPHHDVNYDKAGIISVDTAMVAGVDVKQIPDNNNEYESWVNKVQGMIDYESDIYAASIKGGYVACSGMGDGSYDLIVGRRSTDGTIVQFAVWFYPHPFWDEWLNMVGLSIWGDLDKYDDDDDQDDTSKNNVLPSKFREALSNHKENLMMSTFKLKVVL